MIETARTTATGWAIESASLRDLGALRHLEQACFRDAWPLLDLISVLTMPGVVRLKAVVAGCMVGFVAGDVRRDEGVAWIATIGVLPEFRQQGMGRRCCRPAKRASRCRCSACACAVITSPPSACTSASATGARANGQPLP